MNGLAEGLPSLSIEDLLPPPSATDGLYTDMQFAPLTAGFSMVGFVYTNYGFSARYSIGVRAILVFYSNYYTNYIIKK